MEDRGREPDHAPCGNELRVLIVDAEAEPVLEALDPLRVRGDVAVVGIATTGREGIGQAFTLRPDAVLIDPRLADMDGMHVVEMIVCQTPMRVVIMTADYSAEALMAEALMRAMIAGARGYLLKPFTAEAAYATLVGMGWGGQEFGSGRVGSEEKAETAAQELIRALLTAEEYQQLNAFGYVDVQSRSRADRTYRIPAAGGMVQMLEDGKEVLRLCLQPTTMLPREDVVLLHKLLLEADEEKYLRTANHFTPAGGRVRRRCGTALP